MRALLIAALLGCFATGAAEARRHDPEKLSEGHIRDLHFGDVLFLYFQEDDAHDFEALTRVLAYQHWGRMPHHAEDAELIAGSLYLQEGMHNEAGEIFQRLLTDNVSSGVRNRAWLYLAQVWYARGYYQKAEGALRKVNGRMSPDFEAQRELLLANVLMHQGRYDEAIELLTGWRGSPVWSAYARFNLGVALVRANRLADADPFLSAVGTMLAPSPELEALKDRANLALGFAYLQANQPERARLPLERVRLNGPYSNKALLGSGWAQAALGDYQGALTPWMELRSREDERQRAVGGVLRERGELFRYREHAARCGDRAHPPGRHAARGACERPGAHRQRHAAAARLVPRPAQPAAHRRGTVPLCGARGP
jgi:tetratricopeptide (TPR) repeat protein